MTIKRIMVGLLALLSVLLLLAQAQAFYRAYANDARSSQTAIANVVASDLLKSAGSWAFERGVTNAALNAPDVATPDVLQKINTARGVNDKAFREAMDNVGPASLLVEGTYKQDIDAALAKVSELRQAIDKNLSLPKTARDANVITAWVPAITSLIMETQKLRINLSSQALVGEAALGKDTLMRHSVWMMTEYAGRERAILGGLISSDQPIAPDQSQKLAEYRGKVEEGWSIVTNIHLNQEEHEQFDAPLTTAKEDFVNDYDKVRQKVYADARLGIGYSIKAKDWIARSTQAIDTLLKLQDVSAAWTASQMERNRTASRHEMLVSGTSLLIAVLAVIGALWVILGRVIRPINTLASSMGTIASGEFRRQVPYLDRTDEIGHMAESVEVFRKNGMEKIALEEQAKQAELAAAAEKKRTMQKLAGDFESGVQGIINTVAAAATELCRTAENMKRTMTETATQSGSVASTSEQTTTNVTSVSAAVEEMSFSVKEIASQIAKSSALVTDTVTNMQQADKAVQTLSDAVTQINSIVELINTIAGQINLLALNATIEAARAGDAGKGFAVVASEVKTLATQTGKATGEIANQVKNVLDASNGVAGVLKEIQEAIGNINQYSSGIASAVEEQSAATADISANMQEAKKGVQNITTNIGQVSRGVSTADHEAEEVLKAAEMLSQQSEMLNGQVNLFLAGIRG